MFIYWHHGFRNIMIQCMFDMFKVRRKISISGKCPLVETPRVDSLRAACVMRLLMRAHAVEQGGPYPVPHRVNVTSVVCCDSIAIVVLQAQGFVLGEPPAATATKLLGLSELQESCSHLLVGMIHAVFFCYIHSTIWVKLDDGSIRLLVAITNQSGVHKAKGKRPTPKSRAWLPPPP